jgi:hypothetical protein
LRESRLGDASQVGGHSREREREREEEEEKDIIGERKNKESF